MSVAAVEGARINNSLFIPNDLNAGQIHQIDVSKITSIPSFPKTAETLFRKFQSNPNANPSVLTAGKIMPGEVCRDLKDRVKNLLPAMRGNLDNATKNHRRDRLASFGVLYLLAGAIGLTIIGFATGASIMGFIGVGALALSLITGYIGCEKLLKEAKAGSVNELGALAIILSPLIFAFRLFNRENFLEAAFNRQTSSAQEDIVFAARYLQENSAAIIKGLEDKLAWLEKTCRLKQGMQMAKIWWRCFPERRSETEQTLVVAFEEYKKSYGDPVAEIQKLKSYADTAAKIQELESIKAELEGPGQEMLVQLSLDHIIPSLAEPRASLANNHYTFT